MITTVYSTGYYQVSLDTVIVGLSTDEKPTDFIPGSHEVALMNGSVFLEMDTKKKYMFDAEGSVWLEQ